MASITEAPAKPACNISDIETGDKFRLKLRVSTTLDRNGRKEDGTVFWVRASSLRDYSQVLKVAREYVEVQQ